MGLRGLYLYIENSEKSIYLYTILIKTLFTDLVRSLFIKTINDFDIFLERLGEKR